MYKPKKKLYEPFNKKSLKDRMYNWLYEPNVDKIWEEGITGLAAIALGGFIILGIDSYLSKPITETRKVEIQRLEKAIDNCFDKQDSIPESVRKSLEQCYKETK